MNWKKFLLGNFDYTKTTKNGKYNVKINIQVGILPTIVIIVLIAWLIIKQEIDAGMKIVIQTTKGTIESPEFPEIVREPLKEKIDKLADDLMDSWFNHSVYFRVVGSDIDKAGTEIVDLLKEKDLTHEQAYASLQYAYNLIKYESNFLKLQ